MAQYIFLCSRCVANKVIIEKLCEKGEKKTMKLEICSIWEEGN